VCHVQGGKRGKDAKFRASPEDLSDGCFEPQSGGERTGGGLVEKMQSSICKAGLARWQPDENCQSLIEERKDEGKEKGFKPGYLHTE